MDSDGYDAFYVENILSVEMRCIFEFVEYSFHST
jgi:hypothetical protein